MFFTFHTLIFHLITSHRHGLTSDDRYRQGQLLISRSVNLFSGRDRRCCDTIKAGMIENVRTHSHQAGQEIIQLNQAGTDHNTSTI